MTCLLPFGPSLFLTGSSDLWGTLTPRSEDTWAKLLYPDLMFTCLPRKALLQSTLVLETAPFSLIVSTMFALPMTQVKVKGT